MMDATNTPTDPTATEWHHYQDKQGRCAVCGVPSGKLTGRRRTPGGEPRVPSAKQEHRQANEARPGWVVKSSRCPGGVATAYGVPEAVLRAVALIAVGDTQRAAAIAVGMRPNRLSRWKREHPGEWAQTMLQAATIARAIREKATTAGQVCLAERAPVAESQHPARRPAVYEDGPLTGTHAEGPTLAEFFQRTYSPQRLLGKSPQTVVAYRAALSLFDRLAGRPVALSDLSDELLTACAARHLKGGFAPATCNRLLRTVATIWRFAHKRKAVSALPDVQKVKTPKRVPVAWSAEEFNRLLATAAETSGHVGTIPAGSYWVALLLVLYDTGLRIGALMHLRRDALDLASGWLRVPADVQKQCADQAFRLHADTLASLRAMQVSNATDLLFPWPQSPRGLGRALRRILVRAGLSAGRRDLFHKIRRTSATNVADKLGRAAAQDHLGHSCMSVTAAYLDPSKIHRVQAADAIPRPVVPRTAGDSEKSSEKVG